MGMEYVIVINGVEYPATIKAIAATTQAVGRTRVVVTPTQENLQEILAACNPPRTEIREIQEYIGVDFSSGFLDDNLIWVKAQDFVVEGQWLNLHNIIGDCQITASTLGTKRTMKLQVKSLRMPISFMRTVIRTTTNPLEA